MSNTRQEELSAARQIHIAVGPARHFTVPIHLSRGGKERGRGALAKPRANSSETRSAKVVRPSGFTLIEMLVVIAIIGVLAGMTVSFVSRGSSHRRIARLESEREQLQLWIDAYKEKKGYYPPDNTNNPAISPLYYELAGATLAGGVYTTRDGRPSAVTQAQLLQAFNTKGILNAAADPADAICFFTNLRDDQLMSLNNPTNVYVLVAPLPGIWGFDESGKTNVYASPWRYRSTSPIYNPKGYDLWAEVLINGEIVTNGNWKN